MILIVDDEAEIVSLISRRLKRAGYATLEAASADEARALWGEHDSAIRLVIVDVVLAGEIGDRLIREFVEQKPELTVIVTSGFSLSYLKHRGIEFPAGSVFIAKPFLPVDILRNVKSALGEPPDQTED